MTSMPDDGDNEQHDAEQTPTETYFSYKTSSLANDYATTTIEDGPEQVEDEDTLPQFTEERDNQAGHTKLDAEDQSLSVTRNIVTASQQDGLLERGDTAVRSNNASIGSQGSEIASKVKQVGTSTHDIDDTISVLDQSPSLPGSLLSSPRSGRSPQPPISRKGSTPSRRPFDLRFHSRLSSSSLISPRASSPAFLTTHSRQSSLASQGLPSASEPDDSETPWEVIRWHRLTRTTTQIYSEAARRNFGNPTCLAVSDHVIVGTSKGLLLVFDHHQNHKAIIGSGTKAVEAGTVNSLAISADHTTVAAGHATGDIFTWELGRSARPFLHIPPIDITQPEARNGNGHVAGSSVLHVGFLGFRRTALVSADDRGMAFSHLASRGTGAIGRTVHTTRILGKYPDMVVRTARPTRKSSVLAFAPLPLGNVEQGTDALGLVAMLTPYLLVIVSTTPVAQTQHKAPRPKEVTAHGAMTAALAWFPAIKLKGAESAASKSKLVYAWSDVLTVLDVHEIDSESEEKDKPPELQFLPRSRYKAEEAIVAVQWLSRSVMAVLTITQQLLILEDNTMTVTDAFDLLPKDLYHADVYSHQLQAVIESLDEGDNSMHGVVADAFHMSFRSYKGRLYLLGRKNIWWGSLTNWADRLLAMMETGDFVGAVRLATNYYVGIGEKLTIGLPEDDRARHNLVREKLLEMISASLKYAFGRNPVTRSYVSDKMQRVDLAVACVNACLAIDDQEFLLGEVFGWYEESNEASSFVDVLEPAILDGKIRSLPPLALKCLINHFRTTHSAADLEEIICLLDPTTMDIDQVTNLCKQHGLYDAYIYVWNAALRDYVSPLKELMDMVGDASKTNGNRDIDYRGNDLLHKIFAYMSFVLTSRVYPTGLFLDEDTATMAKLQIYDYLFSGKDGASTPDTAMLQDASTSNSFPRLRRLLELDASGFMSAMNEAFEDSFLNTGSDDDVATSPNGTGPLSIYNRQFLIKILLGVMSTGFEATDTIYLDMFIARNLPKYPQYILLSGSVLHDTFLRLCSTVDNEMKDDAQLAVESLLSNYQPSDPLSLVPTLQNAGFYRVLKSVYRQERHFADLIETCFLDTEDQADVFTIILDCLRSGSVLTQLQRAEVGEAVKNHALDLVNIDVNRSAYVIEEVLPEAHPLFVDAQQDQPRRQYSYLQCLIEPVQVEKLPSNKISLQFSGLYVSLMCQYNPHHVVEYVRTAKEEDLELDAVLPVMESSGIVDGAAILLTRQGQVRDGMNRLLKHLDVLRTSLVSILESAMDSSDEVVTNEAIEHLVESIERYSGIGIWICQYQSKSNQKSRMTPKSPKRGSSTVKLSFEEQLWLDLLLSVVGIAQSILPASFAEQTNGDDHPSDAIRMIIQRVFTALLTATTASKEGSHMGSDFMFLRILRAFLTGAAESSPSLSQLRSVISSIFSAYAYEESLLALSNSMLDKDLFVYVDEVTKLRQVGWRPRGQVCEICKQRVWGPGTGSGPQIWKAWQTSERQRNERRNPAPAVNEELDLTRGKGRAATTSSLLSANEEEGEATIDSESDIPPSSGPLVVFSCRHLFHHTCLTQSQMLEGEGEISNVNMDISMNVPTYSMQLRCPSCP